MNAFAWQPVLEWHVSKIFPTFLEFFSAKYFSIKLLFLLIKVRSNCFESYKIRDDNQESRQKIQNGGFMTS